jgi:hypothetical protein
MGSADLEFLHPKVRFYTEYGNTSEKGISYASFMLLRDASDEVTNTVPEPGTLMTFALSILGLGIMRIRKS